MFIVISIVVYCKTSINESSTKILLMCIFQCNVSYPKDCLSKAWGQAMKIASKPKANILKNLPMYNSKFNLCMPRSMGTNYKDTNLHGGAS
jgi:hypothetical protein